VPQFSKYATLFQVWRIFPSGSHFQKFAALLNVCSIFPRWRIFLGGSHFKKCSAHLKVCRTFKSVPHFSKSAVFFQDGAFFLVVRSFKSVPHSIFPRVAHVSKLPALFQVLRVFLSVPLIALGTQHPGHTKIPAIGRFHIVMD